MERHEDTDRIRLLAHDGSDADAKPDVRSQWWIPLAVTALLVFGVALALGGFDGEAEGIAGDELLEIPVAGLAATTTVPPPTTQPEPETPRTTAPPVPGVVLPEPASGLKVLRFDGATATLETWLPRATAPDSVTLPERPDVVAFDTTGRFMALLEFQPRSAGVLHVGFDPTTLRAQFVDVTSVAWHDAIPAAIAFTAVLPFEDDVTLLTGEIDPLSLELTDLQRVTAIPDTDLLVAWGEWGFAFHSAQDGVLDLEGAPFVRIPRTVVRDDDGEVILDVDGALADVISSGELLTTRYLTEVDERDDRRVMATIEPETVMRRLGEPGEVVVLHPDARMLVPGSTGPAFIVFDGEQGAAVGDVGTGAAATPLGLDGDEQLIDVSTNGRFVVFHDIPGLEVVVVDLTNGEVSRLPVGPGRIVAVDIR